MMHFFKRVFASGKDKKGCSVRASVHAATQHNRFSVSFFFCKVKLDVL